MRGGDLVREARRRAALTQEELASRAGTTQSAIARLEANVTAPSLTRVRRLVRLCGLDLEVALVPLDDSDLAQAQRLQGLSPHERIVRHNALARQLNRAQGTTRAAEAGGSTQQPR